MLVELLLCVLGGLTVLSMEKTQKTEDSTQQSFTSTCFNSNCGSVGFKTSTYSHNVKCSSAMCEGCNKRDSWGYCQEDESVNCVYLPMF